MCLRRLRSLELRFLKRCGTTYLGKTSKFVYKLSIGLSERLDDAHVVFVKIDSRHGARREDSRRCEPVRSRP